MVKSVHNRPQIVSFDKWDFSLSMKMLMLAFLFTWKYCSRILLLAAWLINKSFLSLDVTV